MSLQDLDSLTNLLKADPELRQQLSQCGSLVEAGELLRAAGYALSDEELLGLRASAAALEISDAELEGVAGGREKTVETCVIRGCQGR